MNIVQSKERAQSGSTRQEGLCKNSRHKGENQNNAAHSSSYRASPSTSPTVSEAPIPALGSSPQKQRERVQIQEVAHRSEANSAYWPKALLMAAFTTAIWSALLCRKPWPLVFFECTSSPLTVISKFPVVPASQLDTILILSPPSALNSLAMSSNIAKGSGVHGENIFKGKETRSTIWTTNLLGKSEELRFSAAFLKQYKCFMKMELHIVISSWKTWSFV